MSFYEYTQQTTTNTINPQYSQYPQNIQYPQTQYLPMQYPSMQPQYSMNQMQYPQTQYAQYPGTQYTQTQYSVTQYPTMQYGYNAQPLANNLQTYSATTVYPQPVTTQQTTNYILPII